MKIPYRLKDPAGVILYGNTACSDVRRTTEHAFDDLGCQKLTQKGGPKQANGRLEITHGPLGART